MTDEDEALVARIRPMLKRRKGYSEKKMFGGVCLKGSLIVRLEKEKHDETQNEPHVKPMDITGKVMKGWARVEPAGIESDDDLKAWVSRAVKFAQSLPPKKTG
jgi:hypothetical protein